MHAARYSLLFLSVLAFTVSSCHKQHHNVTRAFYYWKTIYRPTQFELTTLKQHSVKKMYVRFFDVDQDEKMDRAIPVAPVRMQAIDTGFEYVPVVFLTQKALTALNDTAVIRMAQNICNFTEFLCKQSGINPHELQIDCDWAGSNKNKYFALLKIIKEQPFLKGKTLSCTIRMNQVKYQTLNGIPPADRGLIMVYGMGNLKKQGSHNSILDADDAAAYLKYLINYPLSSDIALPLFEWCILFHEQQFRGILHDITADQVKSCQLFKPKEQNLYTCIRDSTWHGYNLKADDVIRVETPTYNDIRSVAKYCSKLIKNTDVNIILFSCDSITLSKFSKNEIETIYNCFN